MTVVKVQVPLFSNDPDRLALVYAEDSKRMVQQALDDSTMKLMKSDMKGFFEADFRQGKWIIGKRVKDQNW